jgi:hypothetical protein
MSPLLFSIFINELPACVKHSKVKLFADDIKLYKDISNLQDTILFQEDITALHNWLSQNSLSLCISKCAIQKLGKINIRHPSYTLANATIPVVQEMKDLGILIDSNLTFTKHITAISNSAIGKVYRIRNNFFGSELQLYKRLLTTYIRPTLEYASTIWFPNQINTMQKSEKAVRKLTKFTAQLWDKTYSDRLSVFQHHSLLFRRICHDLIMAFKIFTYHYDGVKPEDFFDLSCDNRTRSRNRFKIRKPVVHTKYRDNFWSVRLIELWNNLPDVCFEKTSLKQFRTFLETTYAEEINQFIHTKYPSLAF